MWFSMNSYQLNSLSTDYVTSPHDIIDNYDKTGLQINDLLSKDKLGIHWDKISSKLFK